MSTNRSSNHALPCFGFVRGREAMERMSKFLRRPPLFLAAVLMIHLCALPSFCGVKTKLDENTWFELGARVQGWYQSVGEENSPHLNDFMARRAYLYMQGQVAPGLTFFTHIAGDRLGQEGLDVPGSGLGTGFSLRDGWIAYAPFNELKIQAGRMYIPFTRSFGTESTFTLLDPRSAHAPGRRRGKGFFPSNVGRDDGLTVWGNLAKGLVQYRVGVFDGQQSKQVGEKTRAPRPEFPSAPWITRIAGSTRAITLGTKKVLSFGVGFDRQADIQWSDSRPIADYSAWTTDVFFDHPVEKARSISNGRIRA